MKIAQVAPLFESVPPRGYGGTERVVSYLTEELVRQGHEVTLYAAGDSVTEARLVSPVEKSIRPALGDISWMAYHAMQLDMLCRDAPRFDILHFHTDITHLPLARMLDVPHVTTLHGRLDLPFLAPLYGHFADTPLVSISEAQRKPLPEARWMATVHHGLPDDLFSFSPEADDYFAFVGRISREKRLDRAIEIAERSGVPIRIGAKIDDADRLFFEDEIAPLFSKPCVTYLGEVSQEEKRKLLERARALLLPIDWPEPFGLVMIEALSCGTPVIAYRNGSVEEIIDDGVTGFIVDNQEQAVEAALRIDSIDRHACRRAFEDRFTADRMARDYLRVYELCIRAFDEVSSMAVRAVTAKRTIA
ncbi:glycosyltransferase family 4 protein [Noviherbaspirillum galbum]|uniref:Glycosyltransferase family 4 protein n=1 Tax=Noviherbaspirillum galbum TaxID=2709383 RepID=A0A6B3SSQ3_9BURK|nr:glycosyltransferase family 4 protein [Noviherbaspirillum galbum]NEX63681.1 glycosyltransferase family 4 protein [Noviherbaspirillum galbum]